MLRRVEAERAQWKAPALGIRRVPDARDTDDLPDETYGARVVASAAVIEDSPYDPTNAPLRA
jgi:hypothetical protein